MELHVSGPRFWTSSPGRVGGGRKSCCCELESGWNGHGQFFFPDTDLPEKVSVSPPPQSYMSGTMYPSVSFFLSPLRSSREIYLGLVVYSFTLTWSSSNNRIILLILFTLLPTISYFTTIAQQHCSNGRKRQTAYVNQM